MQNWESREDFARLTGATSARGGEQKSRPSALLSYASSKVWTSSSQPKLGTLRTACLRQLGSRSRPNRVRSFTTQAGLRIRLSHNAPMARSVCHHFDIPLTPGTRHLGFQQQASRQATRGHCSGRAAVTVGKWAAMGPAWPSLSRPYLFGGGAPAGPASPIDDTRPKMPRKKGSEEPPTKAMTR